MSKFIRNSLLVVLWLNVAASFYYLMFEMVPVSAYWHAQVAGLKAGWPYLPLLVVGAVLMGIHNKFARIASMVVCYGAALYFVGLANVAVFKVLLQHTTATHLALGIAWPSVACILPWVYWYFADYYWIPTTKEVNYFMRRFSGSHQ